MTTSFYFKYPLGRILGVNTILIIVLAANVMGIPAIQRGDLIGGITFVIVGNLFFLPGFIIARLLCATIHVDNKAISWCLFGIAWRSIRWDQVKRIRVLKLYEFALSRLIYVYLIDQVESDKRIFLPDGPVRFDETIQPLPQLVAICNEQAKQCEIPIFSFTREPKFRESNYPLQRVEMIPFPENSLKIG